MKMMLKFLKRLLTVTLASSLLMFTFSACNESIGEVGNKGDSPPAGSGDDINPSQPKRGNVGDIVLQEGDLIAKMTVRGFGDITMILFPEIAPVAVANFQKLVEDGYYEGKIFHRVMPGFMIQGGSPFGDGRGDPNYPNFGIEPSPDALHFYGALSMANAGPAFNSQQFFIVNDEEGAHFLNNDYTVFGQTLEGFEVIDAISAVALELVDTDAPECDRSNPRTSPVDQVIIDKVIIYTYDGELL
jgi:cyclophilin family peptidyl-prolyl cis-trans isomerase